MVDNKRLLQIIAIIIAMLWFSMIIHKGSNDISFIVKENPDSWGPAIGRYFFDNWAGGKGGGN